MSASRIERLRYPRIASFLDLHRISGVSLTRFTVLRSSPRPGFRYYIIFRLYRRVGGGRCMRRPRYTPVARCSFVRRNTCISSTFVYTSHKVFLLIGAAPPSFPAAFPFFFPSCERRVYTSDTLPITGKILCAARKVISARYVGPIYRLRAYSRSANAERAIFADDGLRELKSLHLLHPSRPL